MVNEDLIDRLDTETAERLGLQCRAGRRKALARIAEVRVMLTRNGHDTWEEAFDRPPTLAQLAERAGADAFVVSVRMAPRAATPRVIQPIPVVRRTGLRIAAE